MKNLYKAIVCLFFVFTVEMSFAQTSEFMVDGLKVIYKQSPKEIISVRLFIQGGTANYTKEQEGIENFAFNLAVDGGTISRPKIAFNKELESLGTTVSAGSDYDYGQFNLLCLKESFDPSWELFTDAILNPAFSDEQFKLMQEQLVSQARQAESDADSRLVRAAMENVFAGQDYAKDPNGTVASLEKITRKDLSTYYKNILGKKRAFLVVIGNLDVSDLKMKVSKSFGALPEGQAITLKSRNMFNEPRNKIEDRDIATNYIRGYMSTPTLDTEEGVAMQIAMSILRDRYFVELRTKRGLTYAPGAFIPGQIITNPYSVLYVSTTDPKQSIEVMVAEINKLKKEGFDADELTNKQQTFLTNYFMGQETLASQSNTLGVMEMKGGWEMMDSFTEKVNNVSLKNLNEAIDKYTDVISWTYLGKKEMISEEDFLQPGKFPDDVALDKK